MTDAPLTPSVRDFLIELEALVDARDWPALDRDAITVTAGHAEAHVVLRHRDPASPSVEVQVGQREVVVMYPPEQIAFTRRDEALRFIEMLGDGRVELVVQRNGVWTTMLSFRDGQSIPFRRTRMPWPTIRPRTDRSRFGFGGQ
jgi:hypothetical protein